MKFGNSGLVLITSAAHYLPYIKGEDQSEYSLSSHIIDLSIIMDIKNRRIWCGREGKIH